MKCVYVYKCGETKKYPRSVYGGRLVFSYLNIMCLRGTLQLLHSFGSLSLSQFLCDDYDGPGCCFALVCVSAPACLFGRLCPMETI